MKLNLGCGRNTKEGFLNVDAYERENKLDLVCDLTKEFPFQSNSYDYIYAEQFIEHLNWLDGVKILRHCYRCLKKGGTLRLVLPHYKKIFQKYIEGDTKFFERFFKALNEGDYPYYHGVFMDPEKIKKERKDNPPPDWHLSPRDEDRKRLQLRVRYYHYAVEIVDWFVHQYREHRILYDFESLKGILLRIGFSKVKETDIIKGFDSEAPTRITSSLYVEAIK